MLFLHNLKSRLEPSLPLSILKRRSGNSKKAPKVRPRILLQTMIQCQQTKLLASSRISRGSRGWKPQFDFVSHPRDLPRPAAKFPTTHSRNPNNTESLEHGPPQFPIPETNSPNGQTHRSRSTRTSKQRYTLWQTVHAKLAGYGLRSHCATHTTTIPSTTPALPETQPRQYNEAAPCNRLHSVILSLPTTARHSSIMSAHLQRRCARTTASTVMGHDGDRVLPGGYDCLPGSFLAGMIVSPGPSWRV